MSDEARVVYFLATRMLDRDPATRVYTIHQTIHRDCLKFWEACGVFRSAGTWERALRRAKGAGMLGAVEEKRVPRKHYLQYTIKGEVDHLFRAAGVDYEPIAHGRTA